MLVLRSVCEKQREEQKGTRDEFKTETCCSVRDIATAMGISTYLARVLSSAQKYLADRQFPTATTSKKKREVVHETDVPDTDPTRTYPNNTNH